MVNYSLLDKGSFDDNPSPGNEEHGSTEYSQSSPYVSSQNSSVPEAQGAYTQPTISHPTSISDQPFPTVAWNQGIQPTNNMMTYSPSQYQYNPQTLQPNTSAAEDVGSYGGDDSAEVQSGYTNDHTKNHGEYGANGGY